MRHCLADFLLKLGIPCNDIKLYQIPSFMRISEINYFGSWALSIAILSWWPILGSWHFLSCKNVWLVLCRSLLCVLSVVLLAWMQNRQWFLMEMLHAHCLANMLILAIVNICMARQIFFSSNDILNFIPLSSMLLIHAFKPSSLHIPGDFLPTTILLLRDRIGGRSWLMRVQWSIVWTLICHLMTIGSFNKKLK